MSKKKKHEEEHVDEAWLLPYSDMLTLLLALFIVMFAMGQTNQQKLQAMAKQFNIIFAGGTGVMQQDGSSTIPMENVSDGTGKSDSEIEEDKMTQVKKMLEEEVKKEGISDKVKVELNGEGLDITIQDVVLFNSGDAEVLKDASAVLSKISGMISSLDNKIRVIGHTDNVPIRNANYRSNWDLSAMRAINVRNYMVSSGGINQANISIQAYADQMPKYTNDTEDGKAKNRRVEICVVRKYQSNTEEKSNK